MEENRYYESIKEIPQGGLISSILANVYLHYALDKWYEYQVKSKLKGESYLIRYVDDFVVLFQYEEEVKEFYKGLKARMKQASLELVEEKTKIIPFGRNKGIKAKFNFLGFTFSNGKTQTGKYTVLKKTNKRKRKLRNF